MWISLSINSTHDYEWKGFNPGFTNFMFDFVNYISAKIMDKKAYCTAHSKLQ